MDYNTLWTAVAALAGTVAVVATISGGMFKLMFSSAMRDRDLLHAGYTAQYEAQFLAAKASLAQIELTLQRETNDRHTRETESERRTDHAKTNQETTMQTLHSRIDKQESGITEAVKRILILEETQKAIKDSLLRLEKGLDISTQNQLDIMGALRDLKRG